MYFRYHFFNVDLKLNKTNSSSFQMTAAINIPPSSVCNKDIDESSASADGDDFDEMYTYNYPKICNGLPRCTRVIYGYEYVFYDFYTLFGDCSKKLQIPTSKLLHSKQPFYLNSLSFCCYNIYS